MCSAHFIESESSNLKIRNNNNNNNNNNKNNNDNNVFIIVGKYVIPAVDTELLQFILELSISLYRTLLTVAPLSR
jgi:hypothetical protein